MEDELTPPPSPLRFGKLGNSSTAGTYDLISSQGNFQRSPNISLSPFNGAPVTAITVGGRNVILGTGGYSIS